MPEPVSQLKDHVGYWLRKVSNHVSHGFALKVEAQGVTVAEWVVLREMFAAGQTAPSTLADRLGLTRGTISKLLDRLTEKELVSRVNSQTDRRSQTVDLTTAGRDLVPVLAALADENDRQFFGHLSDRQRNQLVQILSQLVEHHGWQDSPTR